MARHRNATESASTTHGKFVIYLGTLLVATLTLIGPKVASAYHYHPHGDFATVRSGECEIYVPRHNAREESLLRYYWAGPCSNGLAEGDGVLIRYIEEAGKRSHPNTLWHARMEAGRLIGLHVVSYYNFGNWEVWSSQVRHIDDGWPGRFIGRPDQDLPRYWLLELVQEALNRFATTVPIPGYVAIPVEKRSVRCLPRVIVAGADGKQLEFDVTAYVGSKASREAADAEISARMLRAINSSQLDLAKSLQIIRAAIAGCSTSS